MSSPPNSTTGDYQYQPLDHATQQIRLVTLLDPLENDDAIRLDIKVFEISEAPPYTALSYVWGPPPSDNAIYIATGRLEIRENLFKFLTEFRKRSDKTPSDQHLWIDQLCIDQSTTAERSHQVQMMSDIYSKATSVIAWLGDGSQKADPLTSIAERECDEFEDTYHAARVWKDAGNLAALAYILHNEYFARLWIVQEFILARQIRILVKDVWLMDDTRRWNCRSETFHDYIYSHVPSTAYNIICKSSLRRTGEFRHLGMSAALFRYVKSECADPRDKVYGLLGLVRVDQRVTVDYEKSNDRLYMDVILIALRSRYQSLEPLEEADWGTYMMLREIAHEIEVTMSQWEGFMSEFSEVGHSDRLGRFHRHACPITAMGLEKAAESGSEADRFWFDFQGKRHFIYCSDNRIQMADETDLLMQEDWEKYVPREHGDEMS